MTYSTNKSSISGTANTTISNDSKTQLKLLQFDHAIRKAILAIEHETKLKFASNNSENLPLFLCVKYDTKITDEIPCKQ